LRGDERSIVASEIRIQVPAAPDGVASARQAFDALAPKHAEGTMSFWEMYATRALEERVPTLGIEGVEEPAPAAATSGGEQVAVRLTRVSPSGPLAAADLKVGDLLLEVGGEPFFQGRGALAGLHHWLIRELRGEPAIYPVAVWRDGRRVESSVPLKLGPYVEPRPTP
jgi:hypothetical protein